MPFYTRPVTLYLPGEWRKNHDYACVVWLQDALLRSRQRQRVALAGKRDVDHTSLRVDADYGVA